MIKLEELKCSEIEALTLNEVEELRKEGIAELEIIKDYNCYFIDFKGYFGYSVLVFKNGKHIYYCNDYQLHHKTIKTIEELKEYYIKSLSNKIFTEEEIMKDVKNYNDYKVKKYYISNYWIMQFDRISIFGIGKEITEKDKKNKVFSPVCMSYTSKDVADKLLKFSNHLEESFNNIKNDNEIFRNMIKYELSNHEAGYTCDYTDALDSLDLKFENLTEDKQKIVKEELRKQIQNSCY